MPRKLPRGLVALSSSAIAAVYFAGFMATRAADASLGAPVAEAAPLATSTSTSTATPSLAAQPTAVVSASASPSATTAATATASTYKDGTYTATGTSRRGNVSVSVAMASGRIATVTITGVTTEYPVSRIASLPAQVVSRQSAQVNSVTGATYSAQAFSSAVQQALAKAQA